MRFLCGLTGSGKTSAAERFVAEGSVRLSVDQVIHARHGIEGEDFPEGEYLPLHEGVIAELDERLIELLREGRDVVLDYGLDFWTKEGRDRYKQFVESHGGRWELIYLKADRALLLERLTKRSSRRDADAFHVTEERLDEFIDWFEEPRDEQEIVWTQQATSPTTSASPDAQASR